MSLTGKILPNLQNLTSTEGVLDLQRYANNNWLLMLVQGKDFNPTGATELIAFTNIKRELEQRSVKILALSLATLTAHEELKADIHSTKNVVINYPLVTINDEDITKILISEISLTSRMLLITDASMTIRYVMISDNTMGISSSEVLRVIDSLQLCDSARVATPANWKQGQDCLLDPALLDLNNAKLS